MGLIGMWRGRRPAAKPPLPMRLDARNLALAAKGFLSEEDGTRLYELAYAASELGPCVEIGGYCGKSALFLGEGCRARGRHRLFSVDHHNGSEEQQPGEEYFDAELYNAAGGRVDTFPHFMANIRKAGLEEWVFPIVGRSSLIAADWSRDSNLGMVFIDGGHSKESVEADYRGWSRLIVPGGWLCFHDIYPNPADGGQAPYEVFEAARATGRWRFEGLFGSLGVLRRR
jgi:predicted O-methyltransferase YrrM